MNSKAVIALAVILAVFIAHAVSLSFTQDDAFISYRYVRNFLRGHGLVFNPGERVEGYTNFLWVLVLAILARAGADVILASKILGVASGCASLILLYATGLLFLKRGPLRIRSAHTWIFAAIPPALLASNGAHAYWSISGLETSLFVAGILITVYLYFRDEKLAVAAAATTTLVRPEGVLLLGILILHKLVASGSRARQCAEDAALYILLLAPFMVFKLLYYGDPLPNPFYAKTGLSPDYIRTGIVYFWLFLRHYGFYGAAYLVPILFYRRLDSRYKLVAIFIYIWTLYVIAIGGDVLSAHRFFTPVMPYMYLLLGFALAEIYASIRRTSLRLAGALCPAAALILITFFVPRAWLLHVHFYETNLVAKMGFYGQRIRQAFGTGITLATTTIGAISYVTDARVIDMLGLTDREIARNPETIPGIASTWKEKNYNTRYLLARDPDIIMFSTGARPSAPAEKALFLCSRFRLNYYMYYFRAATWCVVYRRKGEFTGTNETFPDPSFIDMYSEAIRLGRSMRQYDPAIQRMEEVLRIGPRDYAPFYELLGTCYLMKGDLPRGCFYLEKAVTMDEYSSEAQRLLHGIYLTEGNGAAAERAMDKLREHNPELALGQ